MVGIRHRVNKYKEHGDSQGMNRNRFAGIYSGWVYQDGHTLVFSFW